MKVLFAASECVPFVKTGGLADVVGSLPHALKSVQPDMDIRVVLPKHHSIAQNLRNEMQHREYFYLEMGWRRQYCGVETLEVGGITYYFLDNEYFFGRDCPYAGGEEDIERYAFFTRAVLEIMPRIGFFPDVLHCHDWQTGMICALLKTQYAHLTSYASIKTVFTVHNLKYQGRARWGVLQDLLSLGDDLYTPDMLEYYGDASFMKGGLVFADFITTVSPTYAQEISMPYYGEGLHGLIDARSGSIQGILNGIDTDLYNPRTDRSIAENYSTRKMAGKVACKCALQEEVGLDQDVQVPILAMITRLNTQKGLDLVTAVLDEILRLPVQLVVLGAGDQKYADMFNWAQWNYDGRVVAHIGMNEPLSRRIYAGADLFLMPSQFEPCGISQMIAMRYGAVPIVRETGGLKDTVQPYDPQSGKGTGFMFATYNAHDMLYRIEDAVALYCGEPDAFEALRLRGMRKDFSWKRSAKAYMNIYEML